MVYTFDQIPAAVAEIHRELLIIKELLQEQSQQQSQQPPEADKPLTIEQAAEFLHLKNPTIYGLVHHRKIPFSKKGKVLYFSKKELQSWIDSGRHKTTAEIEQEVINNLSQRGGKK